MSRKVILHIGMHKTGSSSIQQTLFSSLDDPAFGFVNFGAASRTVRIVSMFSGSPEQYHANQRRGLHKKPIERKNAAARERIIESFKNCKAPNVIISGEDICLLHEDALRQFRDFLAGYFTDIVVVGYVRPPRSFMESAFQQRVKGDVARLNLQGLYPKYRQRLEKFDLVFGPDKVSFWKFDPKCFPQGDVVLDFCQRLNINMRPEGVQRVNEAISKEALSVLFAYRKFGPGYGIGAHAIPENSKLIAALGALGGERLRFSANTVKPILDAKRNRKDIQWVERRLGVSFDETESMSEPDDGVRSEADLLDIKPATVEALKTLLGETFLPEGVTGVTPQEVAQLVQALRIKLAGGLTIEAAELIIQEKTGPLANVSGKRATALIQEALIVLRNHIEAMDEGTIKVPGFGSFRVNHVAQEKGGRRVLKKQIIYRN